MTRIALGVEYDGSAFSGWQRQSHAPSVQQTLEDSLSQVANENISVYCAGRTDSGVHALAQVVHFDTNATRPLRAWTMGTNSSLPPEVAVKWAISAEENFHARFSATSRTYQYVILNQALRPAVWGNRVTWELRPLDVDRMQIAALHWIGEHDFSSFRAAGCQANSPFRCIDLIKVRRLNAYVVVTVRANAFLHHMVRNLVGVLLDIGCGVKEPIWAQELLAAKNRQLAAKTAPPQGLYLCDVQYPQHCNIPASNQSFPFLPD